MYQEWRQVANNYILAYLQLTKRHNCKFLGDKGTKKDTKGEMKKGRDHTATMCYIC